MFKHFTFAVVAVLAATAMGAAVAQAGAITVQNASFENAGLADGGWSNTIAGWTIETGGGDSGLGAYNPPSSAFNQTDDILDAPADGTTYVCIYGTAQGCWLWQNTGTKILADTTYTLTAALGMRNTFSDPSGWAFSLRADSSVTSGFVVTRVAHGDPGAGDYPAAGEWLDKTLSFDTLGGHNAGAVGLNLVVGLENLGGGDQFGWDNVRLTSQAGAVPEPSALALLAIGLFGLGHARRKRK